MLRPHPFFGNLLQNRSPLGVGHFGQRLWKGDPNPPLNFLFLEAHETSDFSDEVGDPLFYAEPFFRKLVLLDKGFLLQAADDVEVRLLFELPKGCLLRRFP